MTHEVNLSTANAESNTSRILERPGLLVGVGILLLTVTFLVGLGVGVGVGRWTTTSTASVPFMPSSNSNRHLGEADNARELLKDEFEVFWESMELLYSDFYGEIPAANEMSYGAIRGALNLLDDPNTSFMSPEEAEFFLTRIEGSFEGIGARVDWIEELSAVEITEPFENQPAWNAGLKRGDFIIAIDGESTEGLNLTEAVRRIRGDKGSTVVLTILREGVSESFDVDVVRDKIDIPTVTSEMVGPSDNLGYIRLSTFSDNASRQIKQAIEDIMANEPDGLIFDLRGNSGGLLREAVAVSNIFIEDTDVLIERFADESEKVYSTESKAILPDLPLVVLVNGGSASASEIVAGALQDMGRAELIGETTFGKGSVQIPHQLSNSGILRVTIARWYTPNDRSIDGTGLEPDTVVEFTEEDREADLDPQLDAAIDHFQ
ncbi:MAG: S41 family peptidase [Chloroflexota bacterium]